MGNICKRMRSVQSLPLGRLNWEINSNQKAVGNNEMKSRTLRRNKCVVAILMYKCPSEFLRFQVTENPTHLAYVKRGSTDSYNWESTRRADLGHNLMQELKGIPFLFLHLLPLLLLGWLHFQTNSLHMVVRWLQQLQPHIQNSKMR